MSVPRDDRFVGFRHRGMAGVILALVAGVSPTPGADVPISVPPMPTATVSDIRPATQVTLLAADTPIAAQADELARRWTAKYLPTDPTERAKLDERVGDMLGKLGDDGRFRDLKYGKHIGKGHGTAWGGHLIRLSDLMTAWRLQGSRFYGDAPLAAKVLVAMDAYCAVPYDLKDTWGYGHTYADLFETNRIGRICLFARHDPKAFPQATIERWCDRLPPCIDNYSLLEAGANLLWTAYGEIAGALARGDEARRQKDLDRYFARIWNSMTKREGRQDNGGCPRLTVDNMLGEHDTPCMGSYGEWYLNDVFDYRRITAGVPRWQMPSEVRSLWVDVLLDGVAHCYQGSIDPHLGNPLFWLNGRRNGNVNLRRWLGEFQGSGYRDPEIARLLAWEPGVTPWPVSERSVAAFPTIEHLTKHFPRWHWSLRAVSSRTKGVETFSQKDLRRATEAVLLPYGTAFLRRDTRELQDNTDELNGIFDIYDYGRPTGMTTRHVDGAALSGVWNRDADGFAVRGVRGTAPYAGIAAAAHTAVYGWWQAREVTLEDGHGMKGRKIDLLPAGCRAAFVLEDAVVNLGAGFDIRHDSLPTLTSVEQRLSATTPIQIGTTTGTQELAPGSMFSAPGVTWVWYDGVGYLPPTDGTTTIQDQDQAGQPQTLWKADHLGEKRPRIVTPPSRRVFSLFTDHGRTASDLAFTWALVPGIAPQDVAAYAANRPWRILANTTELQALIVPAQGWVGAVFHVPGTLPRVAAASGSTVAGLPTLTVDRPSILLAVQHQDHLTLHAADPLGKAGTLGIKVDGQAFSLSLPGEAFQGATARLQLDWLKGTWRKTP